jgi:hypothetical protein
LLNLSGEVVSFGDDWHNGCAMVALINVKYYWCSLITAVSSLVFAIKTILSVSPFVPPIADGH